MPQTDKRVSVFRGDLPQAWFEAASAAPVVAWDVETSGLDWRTERLGTCQIHVSEVGTAVVQVRDGRPENLTALLSSSSTHKVFHHAPFDLRFLVKAWDVTPAAIRCTKVASKVVAPLAAPRTHSLQSLLADVVGIEVDKGPVRTSDWTAPELDQAQVAYAAQDVEHLIPLWAALSARADQLGRSDLLEACCSFIPARVALELGAFPDVFAY